ncbi:hypothetical protein [Pseudobacteriovorax antillogorgiicola]|uniref:Uncharacterized protein n=1 Tax=Pseudobacteriovorax antillogorgiicola TaxID=1513793 RepID=A0A1Y6CLX0_9BACT|nr:hypothetical protein [Pseudobacteriovorax antillogorgiicola]TCS45005.1 hypothetical protein EDD56_13042 [Pseudobacteriovorax antillogorgiicola]SMF76462.1 hypothetical protein SAMN06296036_13032 [Pseudobacteriovorax antillogorgiicola]
MKIASALLASILLSATASANPAGIPGGGGVPEMTEDRVAEIRNFWESIFLGEKLAEGKDGQNLDDDRKISKGDEKKKTY